MTTVTTRAGKGSALSWAEMDANLTGLNDGKAEVVHVHSASDITSGVMSTARLPVFTGSTSGLVPASGGSTSLFLRADGTWVAPSLSGAAPDSASYWTSTANGSLTSEVNLGALTTGLLKHTVSAGVSTPATAVAGTDYVAGGTGAATQLAVFTGTGAITSYTNLVYAANQLWIKDTTAATSTTTGAFRCSGGGSFLGALYTGGIIDSGSHIYISNPSAPSNGTGRLYLRQNWGGVSYTASIEGSGSGGLLFVVDANEPTIEMYNTQTAATWNAVAHKARLNKTGGYFQAGRFGWYAADISTASPIGDIMFFAVGGPLQSENAALRLAISGCGGYTTLGRQMWNWIGRGHPHKFTIVSDTMDYGTVAVTSGGSTVTGTNTRFTKLFRVGDTITISGTTLTISVITSDTALTVTGGTWPSTLSGIDFTKVLRTAFFVDDNGDIENTGDMRTSDGFGGKWVRGFVTELVTIAAAATTDTTIQLPANSVIEAVTGRVTVVIPTATGFNVGDATTAARFKTGVGVAANTTFIGIDHWSGAVATLAAGPSQATAAAVRLTMTGGTPAANTGRVRITIYYRTFVAPTS